MSTAPVTPPDSRKPIELAKLATIFAVVFGIAFGLCSITALDDRISIVVPIALTTEAVCIIGLLVVGVIAFVRSINRKD